MIPLSACFAKSSRSSDMVLPFPQSIRANVDKASTPVASAKNANQPLPKNNSGATTNNIEAMISGYRQLCSSRCGLGGMLVRYAIAASLYGRHRCGSLMRMRPRRSQRSGIPQSLQRATGCGSASVITHQTTPGTDSNKVAYQPARSARHNAPTTPCCARRCVSLH